MISRLKLMLLAGFLGLLQPVAFAAQDPNDDSSAPDKSDNQFVYGPRGWQFTSEDGGTFLWFGGRVQTRYTHENIQQDMVPGEPTEKEDDLSINRGRIKIGGHLFSPDFGVYAEYDVVDNRLLTLRATYEFTNWLTVRIGQWKPAFNRERRDSSGAQQFAERSIVTRWFTIDRQQGIMASGRFARQTRFDSSYWLGRLSGTGRGGSVSDEDGLWMARYQWNVTGNVLGFGQSDIQRRDDAAGSIAVAYVEGDSPYTRFSSAGGGQLPGYTESNPGQYRLRQALFETAWQHNGFSWQQEYHWKWILDRQTGLEERRTGWYAQAGMFFSEVRESFPEPLELAVRLASVDPDDALEDDYLREYTVAANWFFAGHRNKLTADFSRVRRRMAPQNDTNYRFRLQWDWSF